MGFLSWSQPPNSKRLLYLTQWCINIWDIKAPPTTVYVWWWIGRIWSNVIHMAKRGQSKASWNFSEVYMAIFFQSVVFLKISFAPKKPVSLGGFPVVRMLSCSLNLLFSNHDYLQFYSVIKTNDNYAVLCVCGSWLFTEIHGTVVLN